MMKRVPLAFLPAQLLLLALVGSSLTHATPATGVNDSYEAIEDIPLVIDSQLQSVLSNDVDPEQRALEAVLETNPTVGSLSLGTDGLFTYTPPANFSGDVTFTYRVKSLLPPVLFTIDPNQSKVKLAATLVTESGSDSDSGISKVQGTISARFQPSTVPFTQAQIVDCDAIMVDAMTLDFCFAPLGPICLAGVQVQTLDSDPEWFRLKMVAPGAAVPVANGLFTQTANSLSLSGYVDVTPRGGASNQIPEGMQPLDSTTLIDFTNCQVSSNGTTLTLKVPVNYAGSSYFDATNTARRADVTVTTSGFTGSSGFLIGTAPASANVPEISTPITVTISVRAVDDVPDAVKDTYVVLQGQSLTIDPQSTRQTEQVLAPAASNWHYYYASENPGATWKDWSYKTAAVAGWMTGPALLGHGDSDIVTTIRPEPRTDEATNFPTAYFRKEFVVETLTGTNGLLLGLMRDDAAAVYINGVEVYRDPLLPATAGHTTLATGTQPDGEGQVFSEITLDPTVLFQGKNLLAIEVHQASATSSDLRCDAWLRRSYGGSILINDVDPDSTSLKANLYRQALQGSIQLNEDGTFTYTVPKSFSGIDSFLYDVSDRGGSIEFDRTFIATGANWRYLADGSDPTTRWKTLNFDDSAWSTGAAELGYGDNDEITNIRPTPDTQPIHPAYFFRKGFFLNTQASFVTNIAGRLKRDDAAALYLNNTLVYRDTNLASNATFASYTINNQGVADETAFVPFVLSAAQIGALRAGDNVFAAEVHQASATSSDVSFDLELTATLIPGARVELAVIDDDKDEDGISDTYERTYGLDFQSSTDAILDPDGDQMTNRTEFLLGLDPRQYSPLFQVEQAAASDTTVSLRFNSLSPQRSYQLYSSTNLRQWTAVGEPFFATASTETKEVPKPTEGEIYYRLKCLFQFP